MLRQRLLMPLQLTSRCRRPQPLSRLRLALLLVRLVLRVL
jgi:hypothetical protein